MPKVHHHLHRQNPDYLHHREGGAVNHIEQVIFGLQDGIVSTLGAITGIAIGSNEPYIVLLAGVAIIGVESVSMGVGEYLSSRSGKNISQRVLAEVREELAKYPEEEHNELREFFVRDGWPQEFAAQMVAIAKQRPELAFKEMAYRELNVSLNESERPVRNGMFMFFAYIIGGMIPLLAYFFLPIEAALFVSIPVALVSLFVIGAAVTRLTKQSWLQNGLHMFTFGGIALAIGLAIGVIMRTYFGV